jgi:hypothetical protein
MYMAWCLVKDICENQEEKSSSMVSRLTIEEDGLKTKYRQQQNKVVLNWN